MEGYNDDVAAVFRFHGEGENGHAHGHLDSTWKRRVTRQPGSPIGATSDNLKAAIAGETHEYTDMYPGMAKTARDEGFDEIADWMETLAKAERNHASRFRRPWTRWTADPSPDRRATRRRPSQPCPTTRISPVRERKRLEGAHPPSGEWKSDKYWGTDLEPRARACLRYLHHGCRRCVSLL